MIFGEKSRIEEYIIEILDLGSLTGPQLLKKISASLAPSKQALYKSLRKLLKEEVINKTGNYYSLNRIWLQKIYDFGRRHVHEVSHLGHANILDFEDGDSVVYRFKNPFTLDITWGHLYDIVFEDSNPLHVRLNHHPHEWLMLSRPETEKYFLDRFSQDKKMVLFSFSGKTLLDKKIAKEIRGDFVKVNTGRSYGLKQNQYLSVVGDYVFEVTTDPHFEKEVNEFFNKNDLVDELAQKQIAAISRKKYSSKLKLSKNKKKADAWRKKYKQDFYVPDPYFLFEK